MEGHKRLSRLFSGNLPAMFQKFRCQLTICVFKILVSFWFFFLLSGNLVSFKTIPFGFLVKTKWNYLKLAFDIFFM